MDRRQFIDMLVAAGVATVIPCRPKFDSEDPIFTDGDIRATRVLVEGLDFMELDLDKMIYQYIDVSGPEARDLEIEFFVPELLANNLFTDVCNYKYFSGRTCGMPVKVIGFGFPEPGICALLQSIGIRHDPRPSLLTDYEDRLGKHPALISMVLRYEGEWTGQEGFILNGET